MWSKKKEIAFLTERLKNTSEYCAAIGRKCDLYQNKYNNLFNLVFDENVHQIISVCTINEDEYVIYTTRFVHRYISNLFSKNDSYFEMNFIMKRLDSRYFQEAAFAEIEIKGSSLEIVNIDAREFRLGYGGKLFDYIEKYATENELKKIYGDIYIHTPIGLDNLIRFYEKHGCMVYGDYPQLRFKKEIGNT